MASSGKKKTTMAKLNRERKLRERRLDKQIKKDARKQASLDDGQSSDVLTEDDGQSPDVLTGDDDPSTPARIPEPALGSGRQSPADV